MKKIILISTYCDTEEKIKVLIENLKIIKKLSIDIMIFSPINLPCKIYELCDYVIQSKENPVLDWPRKAYSFWWKGQHKDNNIELYTTIPDHGYANLVQFKRMSEYALNLNYDHFFLMIYDSLIDKDTIDILKKENKNKLYKSGREDVIWDVGLHLMSLDTLNLKKFINFINEDYYLQDLHGDAFSFMNRVNGDLQIEVDNKIIYDQIYLQGNRDVFDFSIIKDLKCFIHKNDKDKFIKIIFHSFDNSKKIRIYTQNFDEQFELEPWDEIHLPFVEFEFLYVEYNNEVFDFTDNIKKIKNNIFIKEKCI